MIRHIIISPVLIFRISEINHGLLNEYKLFHALSIVKIKQLESVLFTF